MNTPRAVRGWELEQLCMAINQENKNVGDTRSPYTVPELSELCICAFDNYSTDSPGYQGVVYVVVCPGAPDIMTSYIREYQIVPSTD